MKNLKLLSIIMVLSFVICALPVGIFAEEAAAADDTVTIIASSDFQNSSGHAAGRTTVETILSTMADDGVTSADGFFCCGDYDYGYSDSANGINTLKNALSGVVSSNMVFVQGNHDEIAPGTNGLSESGNNDPKSGAYGVFVIHEDDYMWHNSDEATIKRTAQNLIDYLNEKLEAGYDKPIFVLSHLALNYNYRTKNDGDGKHANYIFNALNEAGAKGLNIFYLFGHDHSNGWDDYLGGSAIFLQKNDKILIAQNSQTNYKEETLNFTYMNPGYVGYYSGVNSGAETDLTMTAITITGDTVTVKRYSKTGIHDLKSAGVTNAYKGETGYAPNTTVYASPATVELTSVNDKTPIADIFEKVELPENGPYALRINSPGELKDGGKYVMLRNDQIMLPTVVTKANSSGSERTGFDLLTTDAFGADVVAGDYSEYAWTFTAKGSKWLLGADAGYATFVQASSSINAELTANGNEFTVSGSGSAFKFWSGSTTLNYNSRGLINGFASGAVEFSIYECVDAQVEEPDINGDGAINVIDLQLVARYIAQKGVNGTFDLSACNVELMDRDDNDVIDQIDLNLLSAAIIAQ